MSETEQGQQPAGAAQQQPEKTFTQADLDRIVAERLERDRKSRDLTPDEVKALKEQAANARREADATKTEAQRLAEEMASIQERMKASEVAARRARAQAQHGLSNEDAELLLTGSDDDTIARQAARLAELLKGSEKPPTRPVPIVREGNNPTPVGSDDLRDFVRRLTAAN